jgi:hypothetical protein
MRCNVRDLVEMLNQKVSPGAISDYQTKLEFFNNHRTEWQNTLTRTYCNISA